MNLKFFFSIVKQNVHLCLKFLFWQIFKILFLFVQLDEDGGGGLEGAEEDYDALNSETFGSAINGDWEDIHENLVRLDRFSDIKDDNGESDLGKYN